MRSNIVAALFVREREGRPREFGTAGGRQSSFEHWELGQHRVLGDAAEEPDWLEWLGCTGYMQSTLAVCATGPVGRGLCKYTGTYTGFEENELTGRSLVLGGKVRRALQRVVRLSRPSWCVLPPNLNSSAGNSLGGGGRR